MSLELILDLAVKVAVITMSLYPVARRGSSHFAGKAMGARALIYPAAMLLIPGIWLVAGMPGPYPYLADIALGLPFLLDVAGNVFDWFATPGFDRIPHAFGWCFLSISSGLAVTPLLDEQWVGFGLVFGFGAVTNILWEIAEFALMRSGASGLQLTYENTIQDLAMSLGGAAVGALVSATVLWPAAGTPGGLFGWG